MKKLSILLLLINISCSRNIFNVSYKSYPIITQSRIGQSQKVAKLIEEGENINAVDENGVTALIEAAQNGHKEVVELLLSNEAIVNAKDKDGWTALILAAYKGYEKIVECLLNNGADVNAQDKDGWTALMLAAINGHKEVVELLLERGAEIEAKDNNGVTALIEAAENGHKEVVELLVDKGADVNAQDKDGWTALMLAAINGHKEVVAELLEAGANPRINCSASTGKHKGKNALMYASEYGHLNVVKLLLQKDPTLINLAKEDGWNAIIAAAYKGYENIVECLINNGATIDVLDEDNKTPLIWASGFGHLAVVKLLLDRGANPQINSLMSTGIVIDKNALMYASEYGHLDVVDLLCKKDFTLINSTQQDGWTPLMYAASKGYENIVECLLENGAEDSIDDEQKTALVYAIDNSHLGVIELLLQNNTSIIKSLKYIIDCGAENILEEFLRRGVDPNLVLENGNSLLEEAIDNKQMVEILLKYNADPNIQDNEGQTMLMKQIIRYGTITNTILMLLEVKADVNTIHDINGYTAFNHAYESDDKYLVALIKEKDMVCGCLENMTENVDRYELIEGYIKLLVDYQILEGFKNIESIIEVIQYLKDNNFPDSEISDWESEITSMENKNIYDI